MAAVLNQSLESSPGDVSPQSLDATSAQSLEELFLSHHELFRRRAIRLTLDPDEAQDLVQSTFLGAAHWIHRHGKVPRGRDAVRLLMRIMSNLHRSELRKRHVRLRDAPFLAEHTESRTSAAPDRQRLQQAIATALRSLPADEREVVVLSEIEGLPKGEIARQLGVHRWTVWRRLRAARRTLRAVLPGLLLHHQVTP